MLSRTQKSHLCFATGMVMLWATSIAAAQSPQVRQPTAPVSQRRINEFAAALARARREILDASHLRGADEGWPDYIKRVSVPIAGESGPAYEKRLTHYIDVLSRAADSTVGVRQAPVPHASSADNRALWERAARDLTDLPGKLPGLRGLVRKVASGDRKSGAELAVELTRTLQLTIDAQNALRDARP